MQANFVVLTTTTPDLADSLVYHLQQALKGTPLKGNHVLTNWVGTQVEIRISQDLNDWIACSRLG